jgi:ABC-type bacteriocin/lantibiotic exporter with double-glycine peptidase domain
MNVHLNVLPFQETLNSGYCGPASLKIVLSFYGMNVSEQELAELTGATRDLGTTAEKLIEAAEKLGFKGDIRNECELCDIESWLKIGVPVIVDWFTIGRDDYDEDIRSADGHYSVVCGIDDTHIFLQDPETGSKRTMKREVFDRVWFDFAGDRIRSDELILRQCIAIYISKKEAKPSKKV